jgi:peptidoglycan/LPS O-acetylase OafA/YrhL
MYQAAPAPVYFPGFNGIRFLAATSVVVHHIEQYKSTFGYTDTFVRDSEHPVLYQAGRLGVALFFVLSGFLITYLLLVERRSAGGINVRNFYIRRILRIWPLYFLLISLSFFVFPLIPILRVPGLSEHLYDNFWQKFSLFGMVMPNVALVLYHEMPLCSHTASIGVEEQFYLLWPLLIGSLRPRRMLFVLTVIFLVLGGAFFWLRYGPNSAVFREGSLMAPLSLFLAQFRIGAMAVGGIGAYLVFKKHPILKVLYKRPVQWIVYAVLATMLCLGIRIPGLNFEGYAVFFTFLLMNLAANPASVINLENPLFNFMGKISYGLYIYHPVIIVACMYSISQLMPYSPGFSVLLYITSYALTTAVAWLSYTYFEKQFMRLKDRFAPDAPPPVMRTETVQIPV